MSIDLGELEVLIRSTLRIHMEDDDIGKGQLVDLYDELVIGLDVDEELEKTFVMYQWASTISAMFEEQADLATIDRRAWGGQTALDLKSHGIKSTDADVKNAIRSEAEWARLSKEEVKYKKFASIFRSFAMILYRKADSLISRIGVRKKADYGDFNVRTKVKKKIKKRIERKSV